MQLYFKGGEGIENLIDFNGHEIKEGNVLTHCWFDHDYVSFFREHTEYKEFDEIEAKVHEPGYIVKYNQQKKFYYAVGIEDEKMYMHDFMFKYCKKLNR